MRRPVEGKVSHSADFRRAAVLSAVYPHIPDGETWLPYGYRAELAQVMVCAELGIEDCDFTNGAAYIGHWLKKLNEDPKEVFRAASDAQRIADYLLAYHPAYAAKDAKPDDATAEDTADAEPMRKAA